jgi:sortase A
VKDDTWSVVSTTSLMVCLVAGWMVAQMLYLGGLAQDRSQDALYDRFRGELAAATAPIGPVTEVGAPVATLSIPHLGLEQVVVEGTASGDLLAGPGHLRNTVLRRAVRAARRPRRGRPGQRHDGPGHAALQRHRPTTCR